MRRIAGCLISLLFWAGISTAADSVKIVVFPADCQTTIGSLSWLSEGIALSISKQLPIPGIQIVDRAEMIELVESFDLPPDAMLSRASMIGVSMRASADLAVMGVFTGTVQNLKISLKVLNLKNMKYSGDIVANGPFAALSQMENELAWLILSNHGLDKGFSRDAFSKRMRTTPNSAYAYFIQSFAASNEEDKINLLSKAVDINKDYSEARMQLGQIYFKRGDCRRALHFLALSRIEDKSLFNSDFMIGTCYLKEGQPDQAIQPLTRATLIYSSYEAFNNLGAAYIRKGDYTMALGSLLDARNIARNNENVLLNLAIVRRLQGNDVAARAVVEEMAVVQPKNGMAHFLLGLLLKAQGDNQKAEAALIKAKNFGIDVDKLQGEDPKNWIRVLTAIEP